MIKLHRHANNSVWLISDNIFAVCIVAGGTNKLGDSINAADVNTSNGFKSFCGDITVAARDPKCGDVYRHMETGELYVVSSTRSLISLESYDVGAIWSCGSTFNGDEDKFEYVGQYDTFKVKE